MWKGIVMADEKTNQEVASKLKVDLNDLYYPGVPENWTMFPE